MAQQGWTLLVYKLPSQPTRLRIQTWRKLQALGAVYVQDGVAVLPSREDLDENLSYVATAITEMGGSSMLLSATGFSGKDSKDMIDRFRKVADARMVEMLERIRALKAATPEIYSLEGLLEAEDSFKKERAVYLKARRLSYFGSEQEAAVEAELENFRQELDGFTRGVK